MQGVDPNEQFNREKSVSNLLTRPMRTEVEACFELLLLGAFIWTTGFLLPAARRNHDLFGMACAIVAALVALAAWLLLGTGVQSR